MSSFGNIDIGQCKYCKKIQRKVGKGGYWIAKNIGFYWICHECKKNKNIRSYPVACEWCKYDNVKWHQGHTYECPRCNFLDIKK
jgi:hypothetical protein